MESKVCVICNNEKSIGNFSTNKGNVNSVIYNEV